MVPMGTFCIFALILRPANVDWGNYWIYVAQLLRANMYHVVGEPSQFFTGSKNHNCRQNF